MYENVYRLLCVVWNAYPSFSNVWCTSALSDAELMILVRQQVQQVRH